MGPDMRGFTRVVLVGGAKFYCSVTKACSKRKAVSSPASQPSEEPLPFQRHPALPPHMDGLGKCSECGKQLTTERAIDSDACEECDPATSPYIRPADDPHSLVAKALAPDPAKTLTEAARGSGVTSDNASNQDDVPASRQEV